MLKHVERLNRDVWAGHSRLLQVVTHVLAGIGLGMVLAPRAYGRGHPVAAYSLMLLSTALHVYAATVKPPVDTPVKRFLRLADSARAGRPTKTLERGLQALARAAR